MSKVNVCKNEGDVKRKVKELLDDVGAFYFMPPANGYGRVGISDIIAIKDGRVIAIETKFGYNKPTPMQVKFGEQVTSAGGVFLVINENNIESIRDHVNRT